MRKNVRDKAKQFGRGMLNFIIYLVLGFTLNAVVLSHVPIFSDLLIAILMVTAYLAGCRWIERRQPTELIGFRGIAEFFGGAGFGLALFSFVMGLLWTIGVFHPTGWGSTAEMGVGAYFSFLYAIVAEILICALFFRVAATLVGTLIAAFVTSVLFGIGSGFNPGATLWSSSAAGLEGMLLAASYAATGRLWFPIGIHAGWNFAEGSIFQMSLSGGASETALIKGFVKGPSILTGGAYGPEASVLAVIVCLPVAFLLLWRAVRMGRLEQPAWRRIVPGV
jgi:membrane protease YdiL (CAAX protease family)